MTQLVVALAALAAVIIAVAALVQVGITLSLLRQHLKAHRYVTLELPQLQAHKKFSWRPPKVVEPWQPQATAATSPAPGPKPANQELVDAHARGDHFLVSVGGCPYCS